MKRRVLLTGASGFVGSNVLEYFLGETDWLFTCICSWRHKGSPLNIEPQDRVEVVTHDLTGPLPSLGAFDYILHIASESHVDRSIVDPVRFTENNISSTLQVLEYARAHPPKVFVLFSTDEVYGTREHAEWDILLPSNPYAASKAAQEVISIAYWKTFGVPIVITNANNIVGSRQHIEKFVPKIINLINAGQQVTLHSLNGRLGSRYYNSVKNIADALLFIVSQKPNCRSEFDRPSRYGLPGGRELNNLEMAQLIAKMLNKDLLYKIIDAESVRPGYDLSYAKVSDTLTALGWKPPFSLEDEISGIVCEWMSQNVT